MRWMVVATGLVVAAGLSACSSGQPAAAPQPALDEAYLSVVRSITPNLDDSQRIAVRDVVCKHLRAEPTTKGWVAEIQPVMAQVHVNAGDAGSILGASIASGCSELKDIAPQV